MRATGAYTSVHQQVRQAVLNFWGEWEAPSRVLHTWDPLPGWPTYLHDPFWIHPDFDGYRQNTDPWVFGECFRYSNCKQLSQRALRELPAGSVILFGSSLGDYFVLDTCFVVASSAPMVHVDRYLDEAFEVCTVASLSDDIRGFWVHHGATARDRVGGMFSFVPCAVSDGIATRFPRPIIELGRYVNPLSKQSPRGAKEMRPLDEVRRAWEQVAAQVHAQGLELGVWFERQHFTPTRRQQGEWHADRASSAPHQPNHRQSPPHG